MIHYDTLPTNRLAFFKSSFSVAWKMFPITVVVGAIFILLIGAVIGLTLAVFITSGSLVPQHYHYSNWNGEADLAIGLFSLGSIIFLIAGMFAAITVSGIIDVLMKRLKRSKTTMATSDELL